MNHFHFASAHAGDTIAFYERYFGFEKKAELGKTVVLVDDRQFLLAIDRQAEEAPVPTDAHLGFCLTEAQKVRALFSRMQSEGVPLLGPLREPSPRALMYYCLDPSGNRLEIGWYDTVALGWVSPLPGDAHSAY